VLLDNFAQATKSDEREVAEQQVSKVEVQHTGSLDRLLVALADFQSMSDLDARIEKLFRIMDVDHSNALSKTEFISGLAALRVWPRITVSEDEFEAFSHHGELCNAAGELGPAEFRRLMREQLLLYVQRQVAYSMRMHARQDVVHGSILFSLKSLLNQAHYLGSGAAEKPKDMGPGRERGKEQEGTLSFLNGARQQPMGEKRESVRGRGKGAAQGGVALGGERR